MRVSIFFKQCCTFLSVIIEYITNERVMDDILDVTSEWSGMGA